MNTQVRKINFYNEFNCLCGDCPATCCKGWLVPVDENSLKKYKSLHNLDSLRVLLNVHKKSGLKCFNLSLGECTFHDKDGLCRLQKKYGEDYLCEVCSIFPRTVYNIFPDECHLSDTSLPAAWNFLELSCPGVARLFVKHINDMKIVTVSESVSGDVSFTNDDTTYYKFLADLSDYFCHIINESSLTLMQLYNSLIELGKNLQKCFLNGEDPYELVKSHADNLSRDNTPNYHIPADIIDKIMTGGYYHPRVKKESELLYELCRLYFKSFDNLTISEVDSIMQKLPSEILTVSNMNFEIEYFLKQHLLYVLSSTFAELYEDYSFTNKFVIAIARNQLLAMFMWLYSHNIEPVNPDNLSCILYSFHRRGAGNDGLYADICKIICESIYN